MSTAAPAPPVVITETYTMSRNESIFLAELIFGYLATTVGPRIYRSAYDWTPKCRDSIARILQCAYIHPSVAGAALLFIGRLKRLHPSLEVTGTGGLHMFVAAMVVADKIANDRVLSQAAWKKVLEERLTLKQLSRLEMELLMGIGWDTSLEGRVCDDFQELAEGWWAKKEESWSADWFDEREWDGTRPLAFEFFDGVSRNQEHRYSFVPKSRVRRTIGGTHGLPVFYDLAETVWDSVHPGVDPPAMWGGLSVLSPPPSPPDSELGSFRVAPPCEAPGDVDSDSDFFSDPTASPTASSSTSSSDATSSSNDSSNSSSSSSSQSSSSASSSSSGASSPSVDTCGFSRHPDETPATSPAPTSSSSSTVSTDIGPDEALLEELNAEEREVDAIVASMDAEFEDFYHNIRELHAIAAGTFDYDSEEEDDGDESIETEGLSPPIVGWVAGVSLTSTERAMQHCTGRNPLRTHCIERLRYPEEYSSDNDDDIENYVLSRPAAEQLKGRVSKWLGDVECGLGPYEADWEEGRKSRGQGHWMVKEVSNSDPGSVFPAETVGTSPYLDERRLKKGVQDVLDLLLPENMGRTIS